MVRILVFRFSAMGDVVMLLPVLKGLLESNDNVELYLLTQKSFFPFFEGIERLHLLEVDLKGKHHNLPGLFKLFNSLRKTVKPDYIVDLHCVIRTYLLDLYFTLSGFRVVKFYKGTLQKFQAVRSKRLEGLPPTVERYKMAFEKKGFPVELKNPPLVKAKSGFTGHLQFDSWPCLIGIAPFAKHRQKVWGIGKVEELIGRLSASLPCGIVLFGGGAREMEALDYLAAKFPNCTVAAKQFGLADEIQLIQNLDVMLSMDSANMHIAAISGVPVVSVWGATHPSLGFAAYKQPEANIIQYSGSKLSCRPCSVYGNKKCRYGDDIRCMNYVSVDAVFDRISAILLKS